MLDHLQHHSGEQRTNTGDAASAGSWLNREEQRRRLVGLSESHSSTRAALGDPATDPVSFRSTDGHRRQHLPSPD